MRPSNCMLASLLVFLIPKALATLPIYTSLTSYPCVRLLNATTAIGCQSTHVRACLELHCNLFHVSAYAFALALSSTTPCHRRTLYCRQQGGLNKFPTT